MRATLRERHRWVLVRVHSQRTYSAKDLEHALNVALLKVIGELGVSAVSQRIFYFDGQFAIVRTLRDGIDVFRRALPLITEANGYKIHFQLLFTSGTFRGCTRKLKLLKAADKR